MAGKAGEGKAAKRYARALLNACQVNELEQLKTGLEALAAMWSESQKLRAALLNPMVSAQDKNSLLLEIAEKTLPAQKQLGNLLCVMAENKRLSLLPEISKAFSEMVERLRRAMRVEVASAFALPDSEQQQIQAQIQQRFGPLAQVEWQVEPELLGGLRISCGDKVLDSSVGGALEKFRASLLQ